MLTRVTPSLAEISVTATTIVYWYIIYQLVPFGFIFLVHMHSSLKRGDFHPDFFFIFIQHYIQHSGDNV